METAFVTLLSFLAGFITCAGCVLWLGRAMLSKTKIEELKQKIQKELKDAK